MLTEIRISRDDIFRRVARRMEWEGTRSPLEEDQYGRVALSDADRALFLSLFDEAAMHAVDICRPFLAAASNTDEALTLNTELPLDADRAELSQALANMMATHVLAQWQEIVSPQRAPASFARRDHAASKIESILYHHRAPVRKLKNEN